MRGAKRRSPLERTAYHEAGHAVMAWLQKRPIQRASIEPQTVRTDGGLQLPLNAGHTAMTLRKKTPQEVFSDDPGVQERFYRERVVQFMAGDAAVALRTGRGRPIRTGDIRWELPLGHDFLEASGYATRALDTADDRQIRAYLLRCRREAKEMLRKRWHAVESVAQTLLQKRTITGNEVLAIAEELEKQTPR